MVQEKKLSRKINYDILNDFVPSSKPKPDAAQTQETQEPQLAVVPDSEVSCFNHFNLIILKVANIFYFQIFT